MRHATILGVSRISRRCDGGYPFFAMQYAQHAGGVVRWDDWPYDALCMEDGCDDGPSDVYTGTPTCDREIVDAVVATGNASVPTGCARGACLPLRTTLPPKSLDATIR